jgi:transposase
LQAAVVAQTPAAPTSKLPAHVPAIAASRAKGLIEICCPAEAWFAWMRMSTTEHCALRVRCSVRAMITPPPGVRVYLACGYTDMRKGMATLAMLVQQMLGHDPFSGAVYAFRGRKGGLIKLLWHDGIGMCLFIKRLERGQFVGPMSGDCVAHSGAAFHFAGRLRVAGLGTQPEARTGRLTRSD